MEYYMMNPSADYRDMMDWGSRRMEDEDEIYRMRMKREMFADHPRKYRDEYRHGDGTKNVNFEYETKEMKELRDFEAEIKKDFDRRYEAFDKKLKKDCDLIIKKTKKKTNWHIKDLELDYHDVDEINNQEIMILALKPRSPDVIPYCVEDLEIFDYHKRLLRNAGRVRQKVPNIWRRFKDSDQSFSYTWHKPDNMQVLSSNVLPNNFFPSQIDKNDLIEVNIFYIISK